MKSKGLFQNPGCQIPENRKGCRCRRISRSGNFKGARHSLSGFTLIEVIAALVIISMALVSVMRLYALVNLNQLVRYHSVIAGNLLQQKMEEIKTIKSSHFEAIVEDTVGSSYEGFPAYKFYVYETNDWKGKPYLKKIDVKGQWPFPGGGTSEETISTVIADY